MERTQRRLWREPSVCREPVLRMRSDCDHREHCPLPSPDRSPFAFRHLCFLVERNPENNAARHTLGAVEASPRPGNSWLGFTDT